MKREVIEDDLGQTPEEGSSTDGDESYDGDGDQFRNRKEERFIDYYRSAAPAQCLLREVA